MVVSPPPTDAKLPQAAIMLASMTNTMSRLARFILCSFLINQTIYQ
jgi:hypothetical protein